MLFAECRGTDFSHLVGTFKAVCGEISDFEGIESREYCKGGIHKEHYNSSGSGKARTKGKKILFSSFISTRKVMCLAYRIEQKAHLADACREYPCGALLSWKTGKISEIGNRRKRLR